MASIQAVRAKRPLGWTVFGIMASFGLIAFWGYGVMTPWQRLGLMTLGLLLVVKIVAIQNQFSRSKRLGVGRAMLFIATWPGIDATPFQKRSTAIEETGEGFRTGLFRFSLGVIACISLGVASRSIDMNWLGWLGIAALILTVHLGIGQMLPIALRAFGWSVGNLFERPWAARSLSDFWSARWNLAFIEMNRIIFVSPMRKFFGRTGGVYAAFLLSGLFHELAISYPAGGGWRLPFSYFAIQACGLWLEHRFRLRSRMLLWAFFFIPLPLLFHEPFRRTCVEPFFVMLGDLIRDWPASQWQHSGLWVLGGLQLLVLAASFQVPSRLNWKGELPRLSRLNEKLVWTYGLFIAFTIAAIGALTFLLHDELIRGDRPAAFLAAFACAFWTLRLVVDATLLKHEDWPKGPGFAIGHACLTALFMTLAVGYGAVALLGLMT